MSEVTPALIERAAEAIAGQVVTTPLARSRTLSDILGAEIWLKFENLQYTASFKDRGSLFRLLALSEDERARGVVAASAGNHAQGVAYHASRLGTPAAIVMPAFTPFTKVEGVRRFGAEAILEGESLEDAGAVARRLEQERGATFVHPYDDLHVIAGQGTIGLEIAQSGERFDDVVIPIGGGGLFAGIGTALAAHAPETRLTGVEAALYPSMHAALNGLEAPSPKPTLAEGIAVKAPGKLTTPIVGRTADKIVLVDEARLEIAVETLAEIEKTVVEGAGAASLAALMTEPERFRSRKVCLILSGGNIDSFVLAQALLRGLAREWRIARLRVETPDRPGSLAIAARIIAENGGNVLEVRHERLSFDVPIKETQIDFVLETQGRAHLDRIVAALRQAEIEAKPMSPLAQTGEIQPASAAFGEMA